MASRLTLEWQVDATQHHDALHFNAHSPTALEAALDLRNGTRITIASADAALRSALAPSAFERRPSSFTRVEPRPGRWYPRRLLPDQSLPHARFLVEAVDEERLLIDANHPLAGVAVGVAIEAVPPRVPLPGYQEPPPAAKLAHWLAAGPGLQVARTPYYTADAFAREDENDDALFYAPPRFVQHIDGHCRAQLAALYDRLVAPRGEVLDLMSSWVSHLPAERAFARVEGLGMNADELAANPRLDAFKVHDLNADPSLPYADATFDAVICSVSVEYLTAPHAVFREVSRVLKPGGIYVNAFSDRCFPTKAIALWASLHDFERLGAIDSLYAADGLFERRHTWTLTGVPRVAEDAADGARAVADPVYAVWGHAR